MEGFSPVLRSLQTVYSVIQGTWGPSPYGYAMVPTKGAKEGLFYPDELLNSTIILCMVSMPSEKMDSMTKGWCFQGNLKPTPRPKVGDGEFRVGHAQQVKFFTVSGDDGSRLVMNKPISTANHFKQEKLAEKLRF